MTRQEFDDFIKEAAAKTQSTKVDWHKRREEWVDYLQRFYNMVDDFISDYVETRQMSCIRTRTTLNERNIGSYDVDALSIEINGITIRLIPVGTLLIGGKGRVDMVGPNGKVKFVLVPKGSTGPRILVREVECDAFTIPRNYPETDTEESIKEWEWRIMTSPPQIRYLPVSGDAFYSAMLEVMNG